MANQRCKTMSNNSAAAPLPSLAADVARCDGRIYANGSEVCPQREKCIRFLVPPVKDHPRQTWLFVAGSDQVGNCAEFWSTSRGAPP
jgi:hypothetical protein